MKPTNHLAFAFAVCIFLIAPIATPRTAHAELLDELLDSTHDLRAQADLTGATPSTPEVISNTESPISDSWALVNGGSPFSQDSSSTATVDDNTPGLDIGPVANTSFASLEEIGAK